MTVSTVVNHEQYSGNGVTTVFPYRFRILKNSHMAVTVSDTAGAIKPLVEGTDYSITGVGFVNGGNVVLSKPLAEGYEIALDRVLPAVQETDFRNQGRFFAETHEDAFDYVTMLLQQIGHVFDFLSLKKPNALAGYYDAEGSRITSLGDPLIESDAVTKSYADEIVRIESSARASADANIQSQLSGSVPLEASAFSVISWHKQTVDNSIIIPPNMNAWSFGPAITLQPGQQVTIPEGSYWTIANGQEIDKSGADVDYGEL